MIAILHIAGDEWVSDFVGRVAVVNGFTVLGRDGDDLYLDLREAQRGTAARLQHLVRQQSVMRGITLWKSPADMTPNQQRVWRRLTGQGDTLNTAWGCIIVGGSHEVASSLSGGR